MKRARINETLPWLIFISFSFKANLDLSGNALTGTIPTNIGKLERLGETTDIYWVVVFISIRFLQVYSKVISQTLPPGEILMLSNNLSGSVPQYICELGLSKKLWNLVVDCLRTVKGFVEVECYQCLYCCGRYKCYKGNENDCWVLLFVILIFNCRHWMVQLKWRDVLKCCNLFINVPLSIG